MIVPVALDLPAVRALSLVMVDRVFRIGVGVKRWHESHGLPPFSWRLSLTARYAEGVSPLGRPAQRLPVEVIGQLSNHETSSRISQLRVTVHGEHAER
jgi:hypothetical protein